MSAKLKKTFLYKGAQYSCVAISKMPQCKVSRPTLYARLLRGIPVEKAMRKVNTLRNGKQQNKWLYLGKMKTISQLASIPGCKPTPKALESRLYNGWDTAKALFTDNLRAGGQLKSQCHAAEIIKEDVVKQDLKQDLKKIFKVPVNPKKCRYSSYKVGILNIYKIGGEE